MKLYRILGIVLLAAAALTLTGCVSQEDYNRLQVQNRTQSERLAELESRYSAAQIELQQLQEQLNQLRRAREAGEGAYSQEIEALEAALEEKNQLIAKLQDQLLRGGVVLPTELNVMLEELAAKSDLITFDEERGVLRFTSDLTFERGSDVLSDEAKQVIEEFSAIVNSEMAAEFDVLIAGHTDDMRIARPETLRRHPTNWHLSANRAISVLQKMLDDDVEPTRLSARGFGEHRPAVPNEPNRGGNPLNRRVEVFIIPQGM